MIPAAGMKRASAPAKAILFGEHAVVYGQPAIALPIRSLRLEATGRIAEDGLTRFHSAATGECLSEEDLEHPIVGAWRRAQQSLARALPAAHYEIRSRIPLAAGFGSGAALSTALLRVGHMLAGRPLAPARLSELVFRAEQQFHGNPSGIDNQVIVHERPLYFRQGAAPQFLQLAVALPLIGLRGGEGAPTRAVVAHVRERRAANPEQMDRLLAAIGALTQESKLALRQGELVRLGNLMDENQRLLRELGVSSPEQERALEIARAAGALGAKISGAGWGGQVLALAAPGELAALTHKLRAAGYQPVFCEEIAG